uniref:Uncharacterized protein n=1 Tax=Prorocentrum micans TaxID=2945 RepID=A0A7S2TA89_PROMC
MTASVAILAQEGRHDQRQRRGSMGNPWPREGGWARVCGRAPDARDAGVATGAGQQQAQLPQDLSALQQQLRRAAAAERHHHREVDESTCSRPEQLNSAAKKKKKKKKKNFHPVM